MHVHFNIISTIDLLLDTAIMIAVCRRTALGPKTLRVRFLLATWRLRSAT